MNNICVIGAGTMGSGIAAHFANLGFRVSLLDTTLASARTAFDRAKAVKPPHLYLPQYAERVQLGGIDQNLDWISDADWVIEAVLERPEVKRGVYELIEPLLRDDAFVSTNTSGLEIGHLAAGRSESFRRRFMGTHFFNPPRYLKLLELIPTTETDPFVVDAMTKFFESDAARRVVVAKDTPGFIANRFGMWAMFRAVHAAEKLNLPIETVDAITGPFLGRPKSGSFRLNDMVGIDIMVDIAQNLLSRCAQDPLIGPLQSPSSISCLLQRGWNGEKAKQGYYRKEGKEIFSFDLRTQLYRERIEPVLPTIAELGKLPLGERIRKALLVEDEVGAFLREYLEPTLTYAASIKDEVAHSVLDIDRVMRWGFGWEMGPFELMDAIGKSAPAFYHVGAVQVANGGYQAIPLQTQFKRLADYPVVEQLDTVCVRDLGENAHAVSIRTKLGVISQELVRDLTAVLSCGDIKRFVLASEAKSFSVGFDLKFLLGCVDAADFEAINQALIELQALGELIETIPSVAAVHGYTLGAGLELAASCSVIVADAEAHIGLPEVRVGVLPAGRGTALVRTINQNSHERLVESFSAIAQGIVAPNADSARLAGYLRPSDLTSYHPDRLVDTAKNALVEATPVRIPWLASPPTLTGQLDRELARLRSQNLISEYDLTIGHAIKAVYAKSGSFEEAVMAERWHFLDLCHRAHSVARMRHMVENNKPLRN